MRSLLSRLCRVLHATRLAADRSGMAAVEFALLLPVLLTLLIGSYETSGLLLAYLKLESAAETAADLVAQTDVNKVLSSTDMDDITNAVKKVMTPLPTTGLQIAYASVTYNTGSAVIDWKYPPTASITVASLPNGINATTLGTAANGSTDSFIVVQLTYPFTSPLSSYFNSDYTLSASAFNRPRYVTCVPYVSACP
jgi:Flp pilus assembly protein TadG